MDLSEDEVIIKNEADTYARSNKKIIANEFVREFQSEEKPVSVFMAGSPGAGKTEASINLIKKFSRGEKGDVLRVDPDELRCRFTNYTGSNSYLFQGAVSILVDAIHDLAIENNLSFVFDSTFSDRDRAKKNLARSLRHNRFVQILYVYQDPVQAWNFVKKREVVEGRRIRKVDFINHYFAARDTVNSLKDEFGSDIQVDLLVKNIDGSDRFYIQNLDKIDIYLKEIYDVAQLEAVLQ